MELETDDGNQTFACVRLIFLPFLLQKQPIAHMKTEMKLYKYAGHCMKNGGVQNLSVYGWGADKYSRQQNKKKGYTADRSLSGACSGPASPDGCSAWINQGFSAGEKLWISLL